MDGIFSSACRKPSFCKRRPVIPINTHNLVGMQMLQVSEGWSQIRVGTNSKKFMTKERHLVVSIFEWFNYSFQDHDNVEINDSATSPVKTNDNVFIDATDKRDTTAAVVRGAVATESKVWHNYNSTYIVRLVFSLAWKQSISVMDDFLSETTRMRPWERSKS